jgi:hypothetical protein
MGSGAMAVKTAAPGPLSFRKEKALINRIVDVAHLRYFGKPAPRSAAVTLVMQ